MPDPSHTLEPPLVAAAGPRISKIILGLIVVLYGALLLYLPINSSGNLYNSPDEMAVAFFAQGLAQDGHLARTVSRPGLPSPVTPRSILRTNDTFVPVGFVSFPVLFGGFVALLSFKGALGVLAILGALSLLAWYGFLRSIFGAKIALLSVMLTAMHPFVLYWAARPLVPNAWFISLIFLGLYFLSRALKVSFQTLPQGGVHFETPLARQPKTNRILYAALSGLTLGLALSLRPQEGIWLIIVPLYLLAVPRLRKRISLLIFLIFAAIPTSGLLLLQKSLYGSIFNTGYNLTPLSAGGWSNILNVIAPFGVNFKRIGAVILNYWIYLNDWFIVLVILGLGFIGLRQDGRLLKRLRLWGLALALAALWLIIFYGSFEVRDRVDTLPSIGTSFTRYFLPFYVLTIPLAAYGLFRLRSRFGKMLLTLIVPVGVILSLQLVFWSTDESLVRIPRVLAENNALRERLLKVLPEDAVVLTDRADKILFPYREVVGGFRKFNQPDFEQLYGLNLYYETIADKQVVDFENEFYWGPHRLRAVDGVDLVYRHTLYRLELLEENGILPKSNSPNSPNF